MGNWGLITYRETALLYNEKSNSVTDQQLVAAVIAHELAHQVIVYAIVDSNFSLLRLC